MMKKQMINIAASETTYKDGRYLLLPAAADKIGIPLRTLRAWREKWQHDPNMAGLFAKSGKFVFFDLDAWARYLERIQMAAVEDARAKPLPYCRSLPCRCHRDGHRHRAVPWRGQVLAGVFPPFPSRPYGAASFSITTHSSWWQYLLRCAKARPRCNALSESNTSPKLSFDTERIF